MKKRNKRRRRQDNSERQVRIPLGPIRLVQRNILDRRHRVLWVKEKNFPCFRPGRFLRRFDAELGMADGWVRSRKNVVVFASVSLRALDKNKQKITL